MVKSLKDRLIFVDCVVTSDLTILNPNIDAIKPYARILLASDADVLATVRTSATIVLLSLIHISEPTRPY